MAVAVKTSRLLVTAVGECRGSRHLVEKQLAAVYGALVATEAITGAAESLVHTRNPLRGKCGIGQLPQGQA